MSVEPTKEWAAGPSEGREGALDARRWSGAGSVGWAAARGPVLPARGERRDCPRRLRRWTPGQRASARTGRSPGPQGPWPPSGPPVGLPGRRTGWSCIVRRSPSPAHTRCIAAPSGHLQSRPLCSGSGPRTSQSPCLAPTGATGRTGSGGRRKRWHSSPCLAERDPSRVGGATITTAARATIRRSNA